VEATVDEASAADAVVLVTDHDRFDLDVLTASARYVLDTRNRVSGPHVEHI
jgi:UDP-N-acetyl-D-glucosamine dehydrogenase